MEKGFLLLTCLLLCTLVTATVLLSLSYHQWLWRIHRETLARSERLNDQRRVLSELQQAIAEHKVPAACWHVSAAPWLNQAALQHDRHRGCVWSVNHQPYFYWLEQLPATPPVVAYQLLLLGPLDTEAEQVFGLMPVIS